MKAIMYHYVQEYRKDIPLFKYLSFSDFKKQLDYFEKEYGFITKDEWLIFSSKKNLNKISNKILLTFDDGLKCHYNYVFKELSRRNLWGIFFIPTKVLKGSTILDVHKIHILTGTVPGFELIDYLMSIVEDGMIPDIKIEEFRTQTYQKHEDLDHIIKFKRILNYYVDYEFRSQLIDKIASYCKIDFAEYPNYYLNQSEIIEMEKGGMLIGAHTDSHPLMSKLDYFNQEKEITKSANFIRELTGQQTLSYCHPYGGFHSFNFNTIKILKAQKIDYSFNVESRNISPIDIEDKTHMLPRYDCNEFPFGKISQGLK